MTYLGKFALMAAVASLPGVAFAGGYGTAGVKDARVGQFSSDSAFIWCPKLREEVPADLFRQMDCGDGAAQPAVAGERFGGGLFGIPPHVPSGPRPPRDGNENPPSPPGGGGGETPPGGGGGETPPGGGGGEPPPSGSGPIAKWDRLGELGVTRETIGQQSKSFQDAYREFRTQNGVRADWSSFNPPSENTSE